MQTQIQATNMRWEGRTLKVCNSVLCQCWIQLFATIDSHTIIAKQKGNDQIWMTGREIMQEITNKQLTWTWWIITQPPNLNNWKRNLAREARLTIDLILIRNQSTYIEKEKPKNHNKIKQHEKKPSLNSPSPFPLSNPFFCSNNCQYNCHCRPTQGLPVTHAACPLPLTPDSLQQRQQQQRFFMILQTSSGGCVQIISTSLCWSKTSLSN